MISHFTRRSAVGLVVLALSLLGPASVAQAGTIELGDDCSLSDAILSANANRQSGECAAGEPDTDVIRVEGTAENEQTGVSILEDLIIVGDGPNAVIDANQYFLFSVNRDVSVYIRDLEITNVFGAFPTGAILVEGNGRLFFQNSHITKCSGTPIINSGPQGTVEFDAASSYCGVFSDADSRAGSKKYQAKRTSRPVVYTCETLPPGIIVRAIGGSRSGIQCQMLDNGGIGYQDIIDLGPLAAIDIWGNVGPGADVCLPGLGKMLFLDAATSPRHPSWTTSSHINGMTCATVSSAGSIVLLPGTVV